MYDIGTLKTPEDCQVVMKRATARDLTDVYWQAFRRYCELVGHMNDDPSDPLVREFYEMLAAYEQLLAERHGRNQRAGYTRRRIREKGIHQTLIDWAQKKGETQGFVALLRAGLPRLTGEFLVVKYAERFPVDVVQMARQRLLDHGVASSSTTM